MNEYSEQAQKVSDAEISLWMSVDEAFKELDARIPPTVEKAFADLGHQQDRLWQMLMMQEIEVKMDSIKTVSTSREDATVTQHVFGIDGIMPSDVASLFRVVADWIDDSDDEVVDVTLGGDADCTQLYIYCEE